MVTWVLVLTFIFFKLYIYVSQTILCVYLKILKLEISNYNSITIMDIYDLYVLWDARRDCLPYFAERTLKLREKISVETWSRT